MPNWYLGAVLVAAPFFIKIAPIMTDSASWSFYLKAVAFLSACLWGFKVNNRVRVAICLAIYAAFISRNPYAEFSWFQMDATLCGILLFACFMGNNLDLKWVHSSLALVCILSCVWLWVSRFGVDPFEQWLGLWVNFKRKQNFGSEFQAVGSLYNINHSGAMIAATFVFLRKRYWIIPAATLAVFSSTLPIVCAIFGALFLVAKEMKSKKILNYSILTLALLAIASGAGFLNSISFLSDSGRIHAWSEFVQWSNSLVGLGFGAIPVYFSPVFKSFDGSIFMQLHNELLEAFAVGGVLWVAGFLWMAAPIFKKVDNNYAAASCFILLVNSLGNFTFHVAPLFIVFCACYTLIIQKKEFLNGSIGN